MIKKDILITISTLILANKKFSLKSLFLPTLSDIEKVKNIIR